MGEILLGEAKRLSTPTRFCSNHDRQLRRVSAQPFCPAANAADFRAESLGAKQERCEADGVRTSLHG